MISEKSANFGSLGLILMHNCQVFTGGLGSFWSSDPAGFPSDLLFAIDRCSWVEGPSSIEYVPMRVEKNMSSSSSLFFVITSNEKNIFHQFWFYTNAVRHAIEGKVVPLLEQAAHQQGDHRSQGNHKNTSRHVVELHIWVSRDMHWLALILRAYPVGSSRLRLSVTEFTPEASVPGDETATSHTTLSALFKAHPLATPQTCAMMTKHDDASKFFKTHESYQLKDYSVDQFFRDRWVPSIRNSLKLPRLEDICSRKTPKVLYLERQNSRVLIDKATRRRASEVLGQRVRLLGYSFSNVTFDGLSPLEQARLVSDANVLIGAHGAGLTNSLFLPDCSSPRRPSNSTRATETTQVFFPSAIIEVSFRFGWCKTIPGSKIPVYDRKTLLETWHNCPDTKEMERYYNKADYFALSSTLGYVRFVEVINFERGRYSGPGPPYYQNPILTDVLVVESDLIVEELRNLKKDHNYDIFSHPQFDGVERYSVIR